MNSTLQMGVDRLFVIETEYDLALLEAELKWLNWVIRDIEDGSLTERKGEQWNWSVKFEP
jgi:hypothetical protein